MKEKQKSLVLKDGGNKEGKEVEALYDKKKKSGVKDWVKKNYKWKLNVYNGMFILLYIYIVCLNIFL